MTTKYPEKLLVRIINPGTEEEYMALGTEVTDVADENFEGVLHGKVARYRLVGLGVVHHTAPRYVEDETP